MEDSTKFDYKHDMQRSENWNEFNQNLVEYHDLYIKIRC